MSLHAQVERAIGLARKQLVAQAQGSWVEAREGYFLFAANHPSRMIVNGAWIEEDRELDPSLLAEIGVIFSQWGHDFSLYLPIGFSRAEASLLRSAYLKRIVFPTLLLDPPLPSDTTELDPRLALERVESSTERDEFIALCAECFEFSVQTAGLCRALFDHWTPGRDRQIFLLKLAGTVVAAAMVLKCPKEFTDVQLGGRRHKGRCRSAERISIGSHGER